jgi:hypothetical protein
MTEFGTSCGVTSVEMILKVWLDATPAIGSSIATDSATLNKKFFLIDISSQPPVLRPVG